MSFHITSAHAPAAQTNQSAAPLLTFFALAIAMPWLFAPLADAIFYSGLPPLLAIVFALPFEILVASPLLAARIVMGITSGKAGVKRLHG